MGIQSAVRAGGFLTLNDTRSTLVMGAFDRHNFGDLLFPHLVQAMLGTPSMVVAGLAARDLRCYGGHRTHALADMVDAYRGTAPNIVHAGGEVLACGAWEAAAMLLPPAEAVAVIARLESDETARLSFIRQTLRLDARAPYVIGRDVFPLAHAIVFCGVGGIDLDDDKAMRGEVCAKLRAAEFVGVRDRLTLALLKAEGVAATLMPDPAVLVRELFGPLIAQRGGEGECAAMRQAFPGGYLAVQCSTEFGDDATLGLLARQLDEIARRTGLGAVLFRAGAAPWHDDLEVYTRLHARLSCCPARIFHSLDLFDICALVAGSAAYCGSSLHGRIVAMAYGLPRVNICHPPCDERGKTASFAATWDELLPEPVPPGRAAQALTTALALPATVLQEAGKIAAAECRQAFDAIRTVLA